MRALPASTLASLLAIASVASGQYAPLYRLADIDPGFEAVGSNARAIGEAGGRIFYMAYTRTTGGELWSSDGTEAGTRLARDMNPGPGSTATYFPGVEFEGRFYWIANIEQPSVPNQPYAVERTLWRSDGTEAGTFRVAPGLDLGGESNSIDNALTSAGGKLFFFLATSTSGGYVLHASDGTAAGTAPVRATPFPCVAAYASHAGAFYFSDCTNLWRSDGTEAGTVLVGTGPSDAPLLSAGGYLYFVRAGDLWRGTGAPGTNVQVTSFGDVESRPWLTNGPRSVGSRVYFTRTTYVDLFTARVSLWWVDGTTSSPGPVATFDLFDEAANETLQLVPAGNQLFVQVFRASPYFQQADLWSSDGTSGGTVRVRSFPRMGYAPASSGALYFLADDAVHGLELWRSDGSVLGTWLVEDARPGPESVPSWDRIDLAVLSGRAFFSPDDGAHGKEPWVAALDGSSARLLRDIAVEPGASFSQSAMENAGEVLFLAADASNRVDVWKTDGQIAGTTRVTNDGGDGRSAVEYHGPFNRREDGLALFADYAASGSRIWRSDGTAAGTYALRSYAPEGAGARRIASLHSLGPEWLVFEERYQGTSSPDFLFTDFVRSDGTAAGTASVPLRFREFGEAYADPAHGRVLFSGRGVDALLGYELWSSDGTLEGTHLLADLWPGGLSSDPSRFKADPIYGVLFEASQPAPVYWALFATNGEPGGETLVAPLGAYASDFARLGDDGPLLAVLELPGVGRELGRIVPGAGVELVKDIYPGYWSGTGGVTKLVVAGGRMYFGADDGVHGYELWSTDGTPEGTQLVRDITPGPGAGLDGYLHILSVPVGDRLVFRGCGPQGCEPWVTDGTAAGTHLLMDLLPGAFGSDPRLFARVGSRVLINAEDGSTGRELWALREEAVDDGPILLGDLDGNGRVDLDDRDLFAAAFGSDLHDAEFLATADMDGDGAVTLVDYQRWFAVYEESDDEPPSPPPPPGGPEIPLLPSLALLALCGALGAVAVGRSR